MTLHTKAETHELLECENSRYLDEEIQQPKHGRQLSGWIFPKEVKHFTSYSSQFPWTSKTSPHNTTKTEIPSKVVKNAANFVVKRRVTADQNKRSNDSAKVLQIRLNRPDLSSIGGSRFQLSLDSLERTAKSVDRPQTQQHTSQNAEKRPKSGLFWVDTSSSPKIVYPPTKISRNFELPINFEKPTLLQYKPKLSTNLSLRKIYTREKSQGRESSVQPPDPLVLYVSNLQVGGEARTTPNFESFKVKKKDERGFLNFGTKKLRKPVRASRPLLD